MQQPSHITEKITLKELYTSHNIHLSSLHLNQLCSSNLKQKGLATISYKRKNSLLKHQYTLHIIQLCSNHLKQQKKSHLKQIYTSHIIQLYSNHLMQQKIFHVKQLYSSYIIQLCSNHLIQQKKFHSRTCTPHISYIYPASILINCAAPISNKNVQLQSQITVQYPPQKPAQLTSQTTVRLPSDSTELLPSQTTVKHVNNTPIQLPFHQSHIFKVKQLSSSHLIELCGAHLKQLYTSHII